LLLNTIKSRRKLFTNTQLTTSTAYDIEKQRLC
jgi:hypothetical protein